MIRVAIDGRAVEVPEGTLVIEAARKAQVEIPHFCYHPRLVPIAACRLCLVEIEGVRGLQPSCATPVKDGMVVRTATPEAKASHAEVLANVLAHHPLDCPKCERAGCCLLEDFSYAHAPARLPVYRPPGLEGEDYVAAPWGPAIDYDPYKCVRCYRCTRWCDEIQDCRAIAPMNRGHEVLIATVGQGTLRCDYCGGCASVCPTGAITAKSGRFIAKDWEYGAVLSPCAFCANGCALVLRTWHGRVAKVDDLLWVRSAGRLEEVRAAGPVPAIDEGGPNRGSLCARGRFGFDAFALDRLERPLVRREGRLVPTSWEAAFRAAAAGICEAAGRPGEVAAIASGRLAAEDLYALGRLVRAAGLSNGLRLIGGAVERLGYLRARTGVAGTTAPRSAVGAHDLYVVLEMNLPADAPILAQDVLEAVRRRGAGLVLVGDCGARLTPRGEALPFPAALARLRAAARPAAIVSAERIPLDGLDAVIEALAARGDWGAEGAALYAVGVRPGTQAGADVGFTPLHLPGYRPLDDREVWNAWGLTAERPTVEAPRALIVAGADLDDLPEGARFVVVSEIRRTPTTDRADVVFPAAGLYEKEATMIDLFGAALRSVPAARAPGESRPDWSIWTNLSVALGRPAPTALADLRREMALLCPGALRDRVPPARVALRPAARPDLLGVPIPREGLLDSGGLARRSRWLSVIARTNEGEEVDEAEVRRARLGGFPDLLTARER